MIFYVKSYREHIATSHIFRNIINQWNTFQHEEYLMISPCLVY